MNINLGGQSPDQNQSTGGGLSLNRGGDVAPAAPTGVSTGLSLVKGQKVSLTKDNPTLDHIRAELGWDVNSFVGAKFDLDVQVFMTDENDRVLDNTCFIFYNQPTHPNGSIQHSGDNRDGSGDGPDESVDIFLSKLDPRVKKLIFSVTIDEAIARKQSFGQVKNAFIQVIDVANNKPLIRYDLTEEYSIETSLIVGEIYQKDGWRFNAIGAGYQTDLAGFCARFGVILG